MRPTTTPSSPSPMRHSQRRPRSCANTTSSRCTTIPVEVIVMPEIHRGVAIAYCDPPGPLDPPGTTTFFAISPTPADWPAERVVSFYREYNAHALRNLVIHEAMPGHVLQLAHSRRGEIATKVRQTFWSGPFVEGWAVYAERPDDSPRIRRPEGAHATTQDAAALGHQRHARCAGALRRSQRGRGHGADDRVAGTRKRARRPANGGGRCSPAPSCRPTSSGRHQVTDIVGAVAHGTPGMVGAAGPRRGAEPR